MCRIVRDYEKYITRQLKRGTTRQELNVSWLKKNELEIKRHVQDLRDNIRANWTTTGQELSRELRGFWPASRPQSPARLPSSFLSAAGSGGNIGNGEGLSSPLGPGPRSPTGLTATTTAGTERAAGNNVNDFVTGYTLGLIGGVRSWVSSFHVFFFFFEVSFLPIFVFVFADLLLSQQMTKSRRASREGQEQEESRPASDDDSEESEDKDKEGRPSLQVPTTSQRG